MKLPKWVKAPPAWVKKNLPTVLGIARFIIERRTPSGTMTKVKALAAVSILATTWACSSFPPIKIEFPTPSPTPPPVVVSPPPPPPADCRTEGCRPGYECIELGQFERLQLGKDWFCRPIPAPGPECEGVNPLKWCGCWTKNGRTDGEWRLQPPCATPPSPPASPAPCVPTTAVKCATPPPGYMTAPGFSKFYKAPKPGKCYAPVLINAADGTPVILWSNAAGEDACSSCADMRWQNIKGEGERACAPGEPTYGDTGKCWRSHWEPWWPGITAEQKQAGLLKVDTGFVTKDCDVVGVGILPWPTRRRESGYLGNICPREVPGDVVSSPCTPSPTPPPPPPPPPPPGDDAACTLGPDGNYPVPPVGTCPACWKADQHLIDYWGIAFRSKVPCSGPNCPYGIKINVDITPHSRKPYLRHRQEHGGGGSDTWEGCQPCGDPGNPECRAAIPEIWVYPPGSEAGLCDPFSGSLYWCHHKPQAGQGGPTKFEVRAPPFRSIVVDVP